MHVKCTRAYTVVRVKQSAAVQLTRDARYDTSDIIFRYGRTWRCSANFARARLHKVVRIGINFPLGEYFRIVLHDEIIIRMYGTALKRRCENDNAWRKSRYFPCFNRRDNVIANVSLDLVKSRDAINLFDYPLYTTRKYSLKHRAPLSPYNIVYRYNTLFADCE